MSEETQIPLDDDADDLDLTLAAPPEDPMTPPGRWIRENLFSTVGNSIQTVVFGLILMGLTRWLLGIIFAEESDWKSVGTNMRLLMSYNYPAEQYVRIWVTVGTVSAAIGLTMAAWGMASQERKTADGRSSVISTVSGSTTLMAVMGPK